MYKICSFETVICDIIHSKEISEILCIISPEHDILYALFYCGVTGLPIRRVPLKYQFYYYAFITGLLYVIIVCGVSTLGIQHPLDVCIKVKLFKGLMASLQNLGLFLINAIFQF